MTTAAEAIAHWGIGLSLADVPESARRSACRHLLDGVGVALAAHRAKEVPFAVEVAASMAAPEEATLLGDGRRVSALGAALGNGALVHALDFDDTHAAGLVHATAAVLPTAFAVGEQVDARGDDVLAAALVGYEVVCRLAAAVPHGFHTRGFHATSVCGVFASALIAARLTGCPVDRTVDALGIAGSMASGSLEFLATGASTKQLHPGFAGMNGILAARLAAAGASGPASILEGEHGMFRGYTGEPVEARTISDGLGTRWEVERITIKPYPACHLSHASLDAVLSLREELRPEDVEELIILLPAESVPIVSGGPSPRTGYEAKFSLAWCAAAILIDGELGLASFYDVDRPDVSALAARVVLQPVPVAVAAVDAPGRVEVRLKDGRTIRGEVPCSRGGPARPISDDDLFEKVGNKELATAMLSLADQPSLAPIIAEAVA